MLFWLLTAFVIYSAFFTEPPEPVMGKAGVMTHHECARFSSQVAVASCEQRFPATRLEENSNTSSDKDSDDGPPSDELQTK